MLEVVMADNTTQQRIRFSIDRLPPLATDGDPTLVLPRLSDGTDAASALKGEELQRRIFP